MCSADPFSRVADTLAMVGAGESIEDLAITLDVLDQRLRELGITLGTLDGASDILLGDSLVARHRLSVPARPQSGQRLVRSIRPREGGQELRTVYAMRRAVAATWIGPPAFGAATRIEPSWWSAAPSVSAASRLRRCSRCTRAISTANSIG